MISIGSLKSKVQKFECVIFIKNYKHQLFANCCENHLSDGSHGCVDNGERPLII